MTTDLNTLKLRLAEAEAARHRLALGGQRERINRAGTEITYTRTSLADLDGYIRELKAAVANAEGRTGRRILNVSF